MEQLKKERLSGVIQMQDHNYKLRKPGKHLFSDKIEFIKLYKFNIFMKYMCVHTVHMCTHTCNEIL